MQNNYESFWNINLAIYRPNALRRNDSSPLRQNFFSRPNALRWNGSSPLRRKFIIVYYADLSACFGRSVGIRLAK